MQRTSKVSFKRETRSLDARAFDILSDVARRHTFEPHQVTTRSKRPALVLARSELCHRLRTELRWSWGLIAEFTEMDKGNVFRLAGAYVRSKHPADPVMVHEVKVQVMRVTGLDASRRLAPIGMKASASIFLGILAEHFPRQMTIDQQAEAYEMAWERLGGTRVPRRSERDGDDDQGATTEEILRTLSYQVRKHFDAMGLPNPIRRTAPWGYALSTEIAPWLAHNYGVPHLARKAA